MTQYNMNSVTDVSLLKLPKQFGQELCRMFVNRDSTEYIGNAGMILHDLKVWMIDSFPQCRASLIPNIFFASESVFIRFRFFTEIISIGNFAF